MSNLGKLILINNNSSLLGVMGILLGELSQGTSKDADEEYFASDLIPKVISNRTVIARITISLVTSAKLRITYDSGTTWNTLNSDAALMADNLYTFDIVVSSTDQINFSHDTNSDINSCKVEQVN